MNWKQRLSGYFYSSVIRNADVAYWTTVGRVNAGIRAAKAHLAYRAMLETATVNLAPPTSAVGTAV